MAEWPMAAIDDTGVRPLCDHTALPADLGKACDCTSKHPSASKHVHGRVAPASGATAQLENLWPLYGYTIHGLPLTDGWARQSY